MEINLFRKKKCLICGKKVKEFVTLQYRHARGVSDAYFCNSCFDQSPSLDIAKEKEQDDDAI